MSSQWSFSEHILYMQFLGKRIQIHLTYYKNVQNKYSCGSSHSFYQPKGMLCAIFVLLLPIFVLVIFYGIHRQLPSFLRFCALWPMDCCSLKWCVKITLAAAVRQFGQNQGLNAPKCAICFAGACYLGHLSLDLPAKPSFWIYNASMQAETFFGSYFFDFPDWTTLGFVFFLLFPAWMFS